MDIPRHILKTYFSSTRFPLVQHHLDSYDDFLEQGVPAFLQASNPYELERGDKKIHIFLGGEDGKSIRFTSPVETDDAIRMPHQCRLENKTYAVSFRGDVVIKYFNYNAETKQQTQIGQSIVLKDVALGEIPLMLRSKKCYLSAMDGYEYGECKYELGGYFVIDGAEKVLLTQELLGNNMVYAGERKRKNPTETKSGILQGEKPITMNDIDIRYEEVTEYYTGIRTLSEDGSKGPFSHFLVLPAETSLREVEGFEEGSEIKLGGSLGRLNRLAMITLPGFRQPIPLLSVFRALGVSSDKDLYDIVLAGVPDAERIAYDDTMTQLILSHVRYLYKEDLTDMDVLKHFTRTKSQWEVLHSIHENLFTHLELSEEDADRGGYFRRKAYFLGHMLRMAMDVALGRTPASDRDNMKFKRMKTSGVLMMELFRTIFRDIGRIMLDRMDRRLTYSANEYAKDNIAKLVTGDTFLYFWQDWKLLADFEKGFKSSWDGRVGVAQELARPSYLAVIHHLRKTDLQIDKATSTAPPRRLYASQWGIMCPVDSPDGSDIGYKKSLALFTQVSTATPSKTIKDILRKRKEVRFLANVHPSTWKPEWTRIFLNSDLIAVCVADTETLYKSLLQARRKREIPYSVSIAWMRINNELSIYCDAGRPIRPLLQEGVTPAQIKGAKTWDAMLGYLDYVDASESDSIRMSLSPFHPTLPSEIHMSFTMSAAANLVPYSDHNPGPRNAFSIAQQKQAASWYHTNYQKRFDTIAMMGVCPQKPLSQTWVYSTIMGPGGCMPYGENAMVAVTMYGGHNQEDSVIINANSLRRGMWRTMYSHSYDVSEEITQEGTTHHTMIANISTDGDIKRMEGMDYSKLDGEGILQLNASVDENTILVGMKSPIVSQAGEVIGYKDVSIKPKRGQRGRVDGIYKYTIFKENRGRMADGSEMPPTLLSGVKIRIVEERIPVIGDKMASRHSQKGTIGMLMHEEDMPFTASGARPDLIFNPHGIPTRMTVGQFLEAASNKLGIQLGSFVDATPFTTENRVGELRTALLERGFEPYSNEVMYNGQTGEVMEVDIFCGPIYYQRLKHMVEDKINYRDTGPKKLLTHQPTQGRGDGGGLRIGEMERDVLLAYGMSKFTTESMMERSDKAVFQFDTEQGILDTSRHTKEMPYAMGLWVHELESMHIKMRLETTPTDSIPYTPETTSKDEQESPE